MKNPMGRRLFLKRIGQAGISGAVVASLPRWSAAAEPPVLSGELTGAVSLPEGFTVPPGQRLRFNPDVTTSVRVRSNVVVLGTLEMKPADRRVNHRLVFEGVEESSFVGGGMHVVRSDVGFWVMDAGRLDLHGIAKVAWNRSGDDPSWDDEDELVVAPHKPGDHGAPRFDRFRRGAAVPSVETPYPIPTGRTVFVDTLGNLHRDAIDRLAAAGITRGCGPGRFCPDESVTRGQMAAFLSRALGLPQAGSAGFGDTVGHVFEGDMDRLAAVGITRGCGPGRFCPVESVTRGQMAAFLSRALGLPQAGSAGFSDTVGHVFEGDIDRLAAAGITRGCNPPANDRFCPEEPVTRAQLATFLARGLDLPPVPVERTLTTEVLNLSRNVQIHGTTGGRTHVFIRSSKPQRIRFAEFRHVGPRASDEAGILGRYGLHFHHSGDGSRGTLVEGVVIRGCGNHAFVPHVSHGITMRDCIAYDISEDAYWWDEGDVTNDVAFERCVAALVHKDVRDFRLSGFLLGDGHNMRVLGCVAVGVGGPKETSGFHWPGGLKGSWDFRDNIAHNNSRNGIFVWQNNDEVHLVENFVAYHNGGFGIDHGAYSNGFEYVEGLLFGNGDGGVSLHAVSKDRLPLRFVGYIVHGQNPLMGRTHQRRIPPQRPTLFEACRFISTGGPPVSLMSSGSPDVIDFVECDLDSRDIEMSSSIHPDARVRIVEGGELVATIKP